MWKYEEMTHTRRGKEHGAVKVRVRGGVRVYGFGLGLEFRVRCRGARVRV
jgi:hypothetical protein